MRHHIYSAVPYDTYPIAILTSTINADDVYNAYIANTGLEVDDVLVLSLHKSRVKKKTPAKEIKEYIESELLGVLSSWGVKYLIVTDSEYFKMLTGSKQAVTQYGYVLPCVFNDTYAVYVPPHTAIFYDPDNVKEKIQQGISALIKHIKGSYLPPGDNIIKYALYPKSLFEIESALQMLLEMEKPLSIDIEAFSLKHPTAGIGTISFAWDCHSGIAFPVDYEPIPNATAAPYGRRVTNIEVRKLLKEFFVALSQKTVYHNISFDVYVLIYQLFMDSLLDTQGLLTGISHMLKDWDDTKLITYLATNSCAGNELGLKKQAQAFSGNYAVEEITDILQIPLDQLLKYNLIDSMSTWYVHTKHYPTVIRDSQKEIYENLFKPATIDIIQMQLTGMPVYMPQVKKVKSILETILNSAITTIRNSALIQRFGYSRVEKYVQEKNSTWKTKRTTIPEILELAKTSETIAKEITFNPNSGPQLQDILFTMLGLPVVSLTDSKQPSVDRETLEVLSKQNNPPEVQEFLLAMLDYVAVNKLLTAFIPALENAFLAEDGWHYLFGNFNLGGTVSGRLSSSNPNLQNLPANVMMKLNQSLITLLGEAIKDYLKDGKLSLGKLIKSCFVAPPGWLFCGLDFASLEDRISALTTKDPNKLKVYTDGYDGHSLRAVAYFGDQMPDIDPNSVSSVNSISEKGHKYANFRQDSKAPTFALTYQGTYLTLMKNCGFSEEKAKSVEQKYHELYVVSDKWVASKLDQACKDGYITAAFGLRVRTPLLKQVIRGTKKTPHEAGAEGRTAGNALGQSWCLLNSRACSEFMGKVRKSVYSLSIRPCAHIHDAQYYLIRDCIYTLLYTNKHLVKAVQWQEHPDIAHPDVKLGGELSIFYPNWSKELTVPNGVTEDELTKLAYNFIFPPKK